MDEIRDLFGREIRVINVGLESFADVLESLGVPVLHVQWVPPAGGDPARAQLLDRLDDRDGV